MVTLLASSFFSCNPSFIFLMMAALSKLALVMVFWNGMIMESIIFQSVTDYLGRVSLIRRWLLCANIYKVNQRFMGMSQENHLPIS